MALFTQTWLCLFCLLGAAILGCGSGPERRDLVVVPTLEELEGNSSLQIREAFEAVARKQKRLRVGRDRVRNARLATRLARVLARRDVLHGEAKAARSIVVGVLDEAGLPRLCEAGLELALLELDVGSDSWAIRVLIRKMSRRFVATGSAARCVDRLNSLQVGMAPPAISRPAIAPGQDTVPSAEDETAVRPPTRMPVRGDKGLVLVLDPGHGGRNPGAKGPTGLRESDVALSLARRVRRRLASRLPSAEVLLTRDSDRGMSLEQRAEVASAVDADLFVSIHLNASRDPTAKGGVSTFVLDTKGDEQALRLAARENGTQVADVGALQAVIATLFRKGQTERSLALARAIHRGTLARGRRVMPDLPDRGVKRALFYVLVGVAMPAVLVEASFITRPDEERALRSDAYRDALAGGMADGIIRYLAASAE